MEVLTLEVAQKLIARAMAKATADFQRPISVAICDPYGLLLAFGRMEGTPYRSVKISQGKAYTAVRMGLPTDQFLARLRQDKMEASYYCDDGFTALPGGNPLKNASGKIVGGIGVSGLASFEDQAICEAMVELLASGKL